MYDSEGRASVNCFGLLWPILSRALVAVCQASLRTNEGTAQMVWRAGRIYGIERG